MGNIRKYLGSMFDNHSVGASMRKILAFITGVVFAGYLHYSYVTPENSFDFLVADLVCALLCLGIITMEQIIKFKQGSKEQDSTTETTTLPPDESQS